MYFNALKSQLRMVDTSIRVNAISPPVREVNTYRGAMDLKRPFGR